MSYIYILRGYAPVPCDDVLEWGEWFAKVDHHVADDTKNDIRVSTVFLGFASSSSQSPPMLFETVVSGGEHDGNVVRYSTWEEAAQGHKKMCQRVFGE